MHRHFPTFKLGGLFLLLLSINVDKAEAQVAKAKAAVNVAASPAADAKAPPASPKLSPMEQNWADLAKQEDEATPALLRMASTPKEAVEFLKGKLKPLKIEPEAVTEILIRLDSEDEKTWKAAFEELEYYDPRLAIDIKTLLDNVTTKPLRQRLVEILIGREAGTIGEQEITLRDNGNENYIINIGNSGWWLPGSVANVTANRSKSKWNRVTRAVYLLEFVKTPEALALLKELATGHPDAGPTVSAIAAVNRIEGKDKPKDEPKKPMP